MITETDIVAPPSATPASPLDAFDDTDLIWDLTARELADQPALSGGPPAIPHGLDEVAPGLMLAAMLAAIDADLVSPHDRVMMLRAEQRMVSHFEAQRYASMASVGDSTARDMPDEPELGWGAAVAEIGSALRLTRRSAEYELGQALAIRDQPRVNRALGDGTIDRQRAGVLTDGTSHLSNDEAPTVIDQIIDAAPRLTTGQLRARLRRLCIEADPEAARHRYQATLENRRVTTETTPDGTANLLGLDLPAERVAGIMSRVKALARLAKTADDDRTLDQFCADVLLDLLEGRSVAGGVAGRGVVDLHVDLATLAHLSEAPGELAGMGPVIADVARQVAERQGRAEWRWTVTDAESGQVVDTGITRRRPRAALRRRIQAENRTCVFPGCRMPATQSDIDHTRSYADGGPTTRSNTAPLCRWHHTLKTRTGWTYRGLPNGDYLWTSPLGRRYTTSGLPP